MMMNIFQGKSFLKEMDFTKDELLYLIDFAAHLKELKKQNIPHKYLAGKNIALLLKRPLRVRGRLLRQPLMI